MIDHESNDQQNPLLVMQFGTGYRYTVNPPSRRVGSATWDTGAGEDWCEAASLVELQIAALSVSIADLASPITGGRITRQRTCHEVSTLCRRDAPHWPEVEPGRLPDAVSEGGVSTHTGAVQAR